MPSSRISRSHPSLLFLLTCMTAPCSAHVALVAPNGGEMLPVGSTFTIQWQILVAHNTLNWDLEYSITGASGPWLPIAMNLPAGLTSYQWIVPNTLSNQVRVRVTQDNAGNDYRDTSDTNLAIVSAASFTPFGQGCAASAGVPSLGPVGNQLPRLGTTSQLRVSNLVAAAHNAIIVVGFSNTQNSGANGSYPLPASLAPLGLPACSQLASDHFVLFLASVSTFVDWPLTVPNNPAFAGLKLHVQAFSFESLTSLALSNAVTATLGY